MGPAAQLPGGPGHPAAVVAVGGGDKFHLGQGVSGGLGLQSRPGEILGQAQHLAGCSGQGVNSPQPFEGVQAKPGRLVLDEHRLHPHGLGPAPQGDQGGGGIVRQSVVKGPGGFRGRQGQKGGHMPVGGVLEYGKGVGHVVWSHFSPAALPSAVGKPLMISTPAACHWSSRAWSAARTWSCSYSPIWRSR